MMCGRVCGFLGAEGLYRTSDDIDFDSVRVLATPAFMDMSKFFVQVYEYPAMTLLPNL